jgi:class 3 adenylate cyclase/tetratricopeptide (TPR) repeat protein
VAQRKTVTALFSDVVGSTNLAEMHDPETLRNVLDRYFNEASVTIERHGGTVEKFIGDAVVALFGVPVAREDDALRALRAADELRAALARLNESFERVGIHIDVRMGVNTGEVIVDETRTDGFRATGDTMNVAARLEQNAAAAEILIGRLTRELGGEAIEVEEVESIAAKGKSAPLEAFRLLRVVPDAASRRDGDAPLVGRKRELAVLRDALRDAGEGRCVVCTLVGPPGVGKSRLARELVAAGAQGWRVLVGRCPSYGEGVTFLPLADALRPVLGESPTDSLLDLLGSAARPETTAEQVEVALGLRAGSASPEESFAALRSVFEELAARDPLLLVVDDIHWAEQRLLDFLEHLAAFWGERPLFLLCLSRPELLEGRPSWSTPRPNAHVVPVGPLDDAESAELVGHLEQTLESSELARILDAADGNPLFLEQLLALNAGKSRDEPIVVPPSIQALLAARLDQLGDEERRVLEAASIEGRVFHREHVETLLDGGDPVEVGAALLALARRQLVRPARGRRAEVEAFAFAHSLVRDAAYASLPKARRARLHVRLAEVLELQEDALDEIVGLHLADAARLRSELGHTDGETAALGMRAATRLLAGGTRALGTGDDRAAAKLLERAAELVGPDAKEGRLVRFELGRALAGAAYLGRARATFEEVEAAAHDAGERALELRALLALTNLQSQTDVTVAMAELGARAEATLAELDRLGDEPGLALAWWLLHWSSFRRGRYRQSIEAAEQAVVHAVRAGERREELRALGAIAIAARSGDMSVVDAVAMCDDVVVRSGGARYVEAFAARARGHLLAMAGEFERGRGECIRAEATLGELGLPISALGVTAERALVEQLAGDLETAETLLRFASGRFRELGDIAYLSWIDPVLASVLAERGDAEGGLALARSARTEMQPDHAFGQIVSRVAEGTALRSLGRNAEAREAAQAATRLAEATDGTDLRGQVLVLLADLDADEGRADSATEGRLRALELYEQKGDVVSADRIRAQL